MSQYYKVIKVRSLGFGERKMSKKVNHAIKKGWIPQGAMTKKGLAYYQTMVKEPKS